MSKKNKNKNEEIEQVVEVTETDVVVEEAPVEAPVEEPVQNTVPEAPMKGVVFGCKKLNVRKEASTDSEVLNIINEKNRVTILSDEGDWYQVKVHGKKGYCLKKFIAIEL